MWLLTIAVALLDRFDSDLTLPFISHILMCKSTGRMRRRLASPKHNQTAAPVVERLMQLRNVQLRNVDPRAQTLRTPKQTPQVLWRYHLAGDFILKKDDQISPTIDHQPVMYFFYQMTGALCLSGRRTNPRLVQRLPCHVAMRSSTVEQA